MNKKRLILLDAHAIIHRAYHALPDFSTSKGEPTGALYGLSTMLIKLIGDLKPDYIAACFDLPGKTFRHEAAETYKASRKKIEDALTVQLESAKDVFKAWDIPIYSCPGFEADDILGTITENLKGNKSIEIIIASGDMDTMQLVDGKRVQVFTLRKGLSDTVLYDEKKVLARYGFEPVLLPDYKGLRGDPSDNIMGVKGIGEKTATSLITTFGTIEKMYKALKKDPEAYKKAAITERVKNLLLDNEEEAIFSKTLATIRRDAPINFTLPPYWKECLNLEKVLNLYTELEFRTLGDRVRTLIGESPVTRKSTEVFSAEKLPDSRSVELRDPFPMQQSSPIDIQTEKELTMMLWLIDSNISYPTLGDVYRFTKKNNRDEARQVLEEEMDKRCVKKVYEDIEKPLIPIVEEMNRTGVKIDRKFLGELSMAYHKELSKLEKSIWKDAGEEFNINSPKVLSEILFTKLGLAGSRQKKTPTGALSTKESELDKLRDKHEIIGKILDYREHQKLLSTYIDAIPPLLDAHSRLHSTFMQAGTTTGRIASVDPNLQNIPIRSDLGKAIRHAFVAEEGFKLISLDYSQIELRIAAFLSGDSKLIEIFKSGTDIHTGVASRVFKVKPEEVTRQMRSQAKVINFGILYGMGVNALKTNLGTDRDTAQKFYNEYFSTFHELAQYLDQTKSEAERNGYTETLFGRRRYFSGFNSPLPYIRAQAERMAINAPIQGSNADIIKIAMRQINDLLVSEKKKEDVRLILQVHDELVYEVKEDLVEEMKEKLKHIMENVIPENLTKGIPIKAEAHVGANWGETKE